MKDYSHKITFSPYNSNSSVMKIDRDRYFIISNAKRQILDEIFSGDDNNLKDEIYNRIQKYVCEDKNYVSIQDFQYKKEIISKHTIGMFTKHFTFLFNRYVFWGMTLSLSFLYAFFFIISPPKELSSALSFDYSWLFIIFIFFYHELGHATACTKFGVSSCSLGFGITLLMPVLYADVSSSWALEKKQRMVVNFGGIYFQNIFACIFMITAIILKNSNLFLLSKTVAFSTVFQLFPFYKSDGYWILTDLLEEPRLFKKSQKMFFLMLRHGIAPSHRHDYNVLLYYFIVESFIFFFLIKTAVNYGKYILDLPTYLFNIVKDILCGRFEFLTLEWKYLVSIIVFYFMTKVLISNIKIFINSDLSE